ncbi:MAG: SCP2 sterol-binding domain-containing protein [Myxococcota bacterium]|nr:SCP2 sterol-binding domain-containing protein [Myxococcota bacterium]
MAQSFLSDGWFDEAEKIRAEIDPEVPEAVQGLVINLLVKDGPDGDIEAKMEAGRFVKGMADEAPTKLTVPYDVAKKMFIEQDPQASMQAFMSGQIQVEGDMTKIMAMQAAGQPSEKAVEVQKRISDMTE